jgi:hypothetical protein
VSSVSKTDCKIIFLNRQLLRKSTQVTQFVAVFQSEEDFWFQQDRTTAYTMKTGAFLENFLVIALAGM